MASTQDRHRDDTGRGHVGSAGLDTQPLGGAWSCPAGDFDNQSVLTMAYGGHHVVVTILPGPGGCGGVEVTSDSKAQPLLHGTGPLNAIVSATVETPSDASFPAGKGKQPNRFAGEVYSATAAKARAEKLAASVLLPDGARRSTAGDVQPAAFANPNLNLVVTPRWMTVPLDVAATEDYLATHLPVGFAVAHRGSGLGRTSLVEQPIGVCPSRSAILIALVPRGRRTQLLIDGADIWLPPRSPLEHIPASVTSVDLTISPLLPATPAMPNRRVKARGADVARLTGWLNGELPLPAGAIGCSHADNTVKLGATFAVGGHVTTFYWYDGGCGQDVLVDGRRAPYLSDPPTRLVGGCSASRHDGSRRWQPYGGSVRPTDMSKLGLPVATTAVAVLVAGCGSASGSLAGAQASTAVPTSATATNSAAASRATSSAANPLPGADVTYVGPVGVKRLHAAETVTGAAYTKLLADLAALKPMPSGAAECNVENGETATISVTRGGHSLVYTIAGIPCRGVRLTSDGASQPPLAGSDALVRQVRAIVGYPTTVQP